MRNLTLDWCRIVRVPSEWRRRTGIGHGVPSLREQFVDVLEGRPDMPLMMLGESLRAVLWMGSCIGQISPS
jgi:hypothetical protein